jgi:hypothetical protein
MYSANSQSAPAYLLILTEGCSIVAPARTQSTRLSLALLQKVFLAKAAKDFF